MRDNHYKNIAFLRGIRKVESVDYETDEIWETRRKRFAGYLLSKGAGPDSRIVDIGCGAMVLAHGMLPVLARGKGKYFALDVSRLSVDVGLRLLEKKDFHLPEDQIVISDRFEFPAKLGPVDCAFSNSLFSHLSLNSIYLCLNNLFAVLREGGVYYSTFFKVADEDHDPGQIYKHGTLRTQVWSDVFSYKLDVMRTVASAAGYRLRVEHGFNPGQIVGAFTRDSGIRKRLAAFQTRRHGPAPTGDPKPSWTDLQE